MADQPEPIAERAAQGVPEYQGMSYDMFLRSIAGEAPENERFSAWRKAAEDDQRYVFELQRQGAQRPLIQVTRTTGERLELINLSSYNYLGYGYHPDVIEAAKRALDTHGLGAASSPVNGGTLKVHAELELALVQLLDLPGRGVSLFSSGYGVNTGVLSAVLKRKQHAVLDELAHASLVEGAQLSGARVRFFPHNDVSALRSILAELGSKERVVVCTEGIFSGDGDYADLAGIVSAAKEHGALTLVDEAHSIGCVGPGGRGVAAEQGVLEDIDFFVVTFSKAFGGVGGAVVTTREWAHYINWYARCRMFSCAIDPAVCGGVTEAVRLVGGEDGARRRARLHDNAAFFWSLLEGRVDLGLSEGWIVTVHYGDEQRTLPLIDWLQRRGLDSSLMQFPAVAEGEARLRLFMSSEHTGEQLTRAADVILEASRRFGFAREGRR